MANRIGILSDTHLNGCSKDFSSLIELAFKDCTMIIHAGDITDLSVLGAFSEKDLYAVHGNMCSRAVRNRLPESRTVSVDGYAIAICHGAGMGDSIEDHLLHRFADSDCIVYGHTHRPANHRLAGVLFLNPGSFFGTGHYGSPGSYAILETLKTGLKATIHSL